MPNFHYYSLALADRAISHPYHSQWIEGILQSVLPLFFIFLAPCIFYSFCWSRIDLLFRIPIFNDVVSWLQNNPMSCRITWYRFTLIHCKQKITTGAETAWLCDWASLLPNDGSQTLWIGKMRNLPLWRCVKIDERKLFDVMALVFDSNIYFHYLN